MTEESTEGCPVVDLNRDDPTRYKRMMDLVRDSGARHAWAAMVPTGELSCWTRDKYVIFVQRIGDSVEVYTNETAPRTWEEVADWLKTL
jgi:hypothetical protein